MRALYWPHGVALEFMFVSRSDMLGTHLEAQPGVGAWQCRKGVRSGVRADERTTAATMDARHGLV
jgi:hypothetical protein